MLGTPAGEPVARRDRLLIIYDVLSILRERGSLVKTRLMNLANLNTKSFTEYIDNLLVPLGLVERRSENRGTRRKVTYTITHRGLWLYGLLELIVTYTSTSMVTERRALVKHLEELGASVSLNHGLHGDTGFLYLHDALVEYGGQRAVVTILRNHKDLYFIEPIIGIGTVLLSSIDTTVNHLLVVPTTNTSRLAQKVIRSCTPRPRLVTYSITDGPADIAKRIVAALSGSTP